MSVATDTWDVIVVGARCSGATLATILARRGVRVLLLEAGARGTGMAMSTHYLQPPGMEVLDRLGIGDRVREVTPATQCLRVAFDNEVVLAPLIQDRYAYCIRRSTLDPWLQDAAEEAGADVRYHHKVVAVVRDGERVTGVVVKVPDGEQVFHANLVVGADGVQSVIAEQVAAEEYLVSEGNRGGFWQYFPAPPHWEQPWDATLEHIGDHLRYVFRTDGGLLIMVATGPQSEVDQWGAHHRERTLDMLRASPTTRPFIEGKEPVGKGCGLLRARYFYRRPIGPGWALVGDAGHFKDFVTGQGMADALLDAERLAEAIIDGREAAFEHFWRERDVATLPLHFDAIRQGAVGHNTPFMRWVFAHLGKRPDITSRMALVMTRDITPEQFLPQLLLFLWMGKALLGGRFDVLRRFLVFGKQLGLERKELTARQALLETARRRVVLTNTVPAS